MMIPVCDRIQNIVGKEKMLVTSIFSIIVPKLCGFFFNFIFNVTALKHAMAWVRVNPYNAGTKLNCFSGQCRSRSDCTQKVQSDLDLHCLLNSYML